MEFSIDINNVLLEQQDQVESGEYNVTECSFIFSSEFDGLTKKAVFTGEDGTAYLQTIVDNKCSIPSEILEVSQVVEIGVYAYDVENEELVLRYSPEPTQFYIHQGSYKEAQNSTPPTPTEIEQLQSQITSNKNDIEEIQGNIAEINQTLGTIATDIEEITGDISDIKAEQITQNENIQKNTDDITDINNSIGTINSNINDIQGDISDIKAEQITQNGDIQTNANDISDIKAEQITQNGDIQTNANDISDIKEEQLTQNQNIQTNAQNISNETLNRQQADNNLQSQIDAITVSSDVIDVLGTYQDLQNYDTSHVKANDIIKVLQDSTHNDSMSYYRWVIVDHVGSWQYVGSEGPYYTKAETDTLLNTKANSSDVYTKSETYNKTEVNTLLDGKVDKEQGKGLSSNDFTDNDKNQIEANQTAITNIKDGTTIDSFGDVETALNGKEDVSNKVTSISNQSTDTQYPSAKCVYDSQEEQDTEIEALQAENVELKQDITNMAKAMYKVDGQGSDITLQNTSENKFVELGLEGRTEQEQYQGYNLWRPNVEFPFTQNGLTVDYDEDAQIYTLNGSCNGQYVNIFDGALTDVASGDTFMMKIEKISGSVNSGTGGRSFWTGVYKDDSEQGNTWVCSVTLDSNQTSNTGTNTVNVDGTTRAFFWLYGSGYEFNNFKVRVLFAKSSNTSLEWEPYCGGIPSPNPDFPQQIKNVTGNANVKIQNKNISNLPSNTALPMQEVSTTVFESEKDETFENLTISFIFKNAKFTNNTAAIINFKKADNTNQYMTPLYFPIPVNTILNGTYSKTYTNITFNRAIAYLGSEFVNFVQGQVSIQIEQGTTATSYVPHQEQNYPFTFAQSQRGMQGTQLLDNGIHNIRSHYIITGNENWGYYNFESESLYFAGAVRFNNIKYFSTIGSLLCNSLLADNGAIYNKTREAIGCLVDGYLYICLKKSTIGATTENTKEECVELLKQYLATQYQNNMPYEIEYTLIDEEIIPYNETQATQYNAIKNAKSYDDITYITSESDELGFNMNVVAVADANKVINSLDTRLLALESEV